MKGEAANASGMVVLTTARDGFQARVIAARLGSEGIVVQLRGPGTDGQYPLGPAEVLVPVAELEEACELLLADEVAEALSDGDPEMAPRRAPLALWLVVAVLVSMPVFTIVRSVT